MDPPPGAHLPQRRARTAPARARLAPSRGGRRRGTPPRHLHCAHLLLQPRRERAVQRGCLVAAPRRREALAGGAPLRRPAGDFHALLHGCEHHHLPQYSDIIIRSATLQELDIKSDTPFMFCIHIDAPALKQLALSFSTGGGITVAVSILAPLLEKVSWRCRYTTVTVGLGRWGLYKVTLKPAESNAQRDLTRSGEDDCLQLPHAHVLSLHSFAHISFSFPEAAAELTTEIEKHTIIHFSVLELHFMTRGHVFGALALHILGMHRISSATRSLKIVLWKEDKEACPVNCTCDEPWNWRSQSIFLTNLENIEIKGFEGENHEFDFLELLLRCATMLKRLTVRPSDEVTTSNDWCTKIYDIFKAYPFVECNLDLIPGSTQDSHSGAST